MHEVRCITEVKPYSVLASVYVLYLVEDEGLRNEVSHARPYLLNHPKIHLLWIRPTGKFHECFSLESFVLVFL